MDMGAVRLLIIAVIAFIWHWPRNEKLQRSCIMEGSGAIAKSSGKKPS